MPGAWVPTLCHISRRFFAGTALITSTLCFGSELEATEGKVFMGMQSLGSEEGWALYVPDDPKTPPCVLPLGEKHVNKPAPSFGKEGWEERK